MKPLIGICANYSFDEDVGLSTGLGMNGQTWQMLADDYVHAIESAGGIPVILPLLSDEETVHSVLEKVDGLLMTGGEDIDPQYYKEMPREGLGYINPKRDRHEFTLLKQALYETKLPILAICRGMQMLNVVAGGNVYQDLVREKVGSIKHNMTGTMRSHPVHSVVLKKESKLRGIFLTEEIHVNSFNHQAVKEVGEAFQIAATAPDGLIEAIEYEGDRFVCAVQWHPEMMFESDDASFQLFKSFVTHCKTNE